MFWPRPPCLLSGGSPSHVWYNTQRGDKTSKNTHQTHQRTRARSPWGARTRLRVSGVFGHVCIFSGSRESQLMQYEPAAFWRQSKASLTSQHGPGPDHLNPSILPPPPDLLWGHRLPAPPRLRPIAGRRQLQGRAAEGLGGEDERGVNKGRWCWRLIGWRVNGHTVALDKKWKKRSLLFLWKWSSWGGTSSPTATLLTSNHQTLKSYEQTKKSILQILFLNMMLTINRTEGGSIGLMVDFQVEVGLKIMCRKTDIQHPSTSTS